MSSNAPPLRCAAVSSTDLPIPPNRSMAKKSTARSRSRSAASDDGGAVATAEPQTPEKKGGRSRGGKKDGRKRDAKKGAKKRGGSQAKNSRAQSSTTKASTAKASRAKSSKGKASKGKSSKAKTSKAKTSRAKSSKAKSSKYSAKSADRHELYQLSVQSPDADVDFLLETYRALRGGDPTHLREDFCGTGFLMAEWLRRSEANTAEGYDIDPDPVEWGKARNFEKIDEPFERAHFHLEDVREPSRTPPQVRTAPNFSWMIFAERETLLEYFRAVREDLADDGLFVFDIYGGSEAYEEMQEKRRIPAGFTYIWDQVAYHPATGAYHCQIHFRFKDGTKLDAAYDYHWRLWSLPEVVDIAREAGFSAVDSYWEGTDDDEVSGNGVFEKDALGENCPAWVTYVVAQK